METSRILITEIAESDNNPRLITKDKMEALINSILSLPKMLDMRPIVIDGKAIIGGNMRHRALSIIAGMEAEELAARLDSIGYIAKHTKAERDHLIQHWAAWCANPIVSVIDVTRLPADDKKAFVVKDNVSYGMWDDVKLQKFDSTLVGELGVDEWSVPTTMETDVVIGSEVNIAEVEEKRMLIVYPRKSIEAVAELLGVAELHKPSYKLSELCAMRQI